MPALGNIAVADAETSPVTHTYGPVTTDGSLAILANRSANTPQGFETLRIALNEPSTAKGAYSLNIGFNDPVEALVNSQYVVARNNSAKLSVNFSNASTAQERKNTLKLMANLLAHATVVDMVDKLEPIY